PDPAQPGPDGRPARPQAHHRRTLPFDPTRCRQRAVACRVARGRAPVPRSKQPGRRWAYTGAILGGLASIAANVAHSFLPPPDAPVTWEPEPGAVVGAIVWPVFLFVAVEILARVVWPHGWSWGFVRWAGLLPVAGGAAFVSYRHMSRLLAHSAA